MNNALMKTEYSTVFDEKRKGLVEQSYYKYGPARMNFATGNVDAIESLKMNLAKFEETGNLEYLCDVANYAMFRFMFPQQGDPNWEGLESADQIISISYDTSQMCYVVFWREL